MVVAYVLSLLLSPIAFLAWRHKYNWGGGFGRRSGLWTVGSVVALAIVVVIMTVTLSLGPDRIRTLFGGGLSGRGYLVGFLLPGCGAGIAIFPQAACVLSGNYADFAAARATRTYALLGWSMLFAWGLSVSFVLFILP
jgi:hypothetical protein